MVAEIDKAWTYQFFTPGGSFGSSTLPLDKWSGYCGDFCVEELPAEELPDEELLDVEPLEVEPLGKNEASP